MSRIVLSFDGERFVCDCPYEKRYFPKDARFRWQPEEKLWYTYSPYDAVKLQRFANQSAMDRLRIRFSETEEKDKPRRTVRGNYRYNM